MSGSVLTGTQQGSFAGAAPTNKQVSWGSCTVVEIKNGKAVRTRRSGPEHYAGRASERNGGGTSEPTIATDIYG